MGENQTAYIKSFEMQKRNRKDQEYHKHSARAWNLLSDVQKNGLVLVLQRKARKILGKKILTERTEE